MSIFKEAFASIKIEILVVRQYKNPSLAFATNEWIGGMGGSGNDAAADETQKQLVAPRCLAAAPQTKIAILPSLTLEAATNGNNADPCPRILRSPSQGEAVLSLRPCVADLCSWITSCKLRL